MALPLIYQTATLVAATEQIPLQPTWLRDRYFPTSDDDIFATEKVFFDYRVGDIKAAPAVMERHKGILMERDGFRTFELEPPFVAPMRTITIDNLMHRGFGEALHSGLTPEDREGALLARDLQDLNRFIDNREEQMCASLMIDSALTLKSYADQYGSGSFDPFTIRYFEGTTNPNALTVNAPWTDSDANPLGDLGAAILMLTSKGAACSDIIAHPGVIDALLDDEKFLKLLDNRNYDIGSIAPSAQNENVSNYGTINIRGRKMTLYSYDRQIIDEDGKNAVSIIPEGTIIVTAPGAGRILYGAVSQIEEDDREWHTYASRRVPKFFTDTDNDVRTLRMATRPLPAPLTVYPWVSMQVFE